MQPIISNSDVSISLKCSQKRINNIQSINQKYYLHTLSTQQKTNEWNRTKLRLLIFNVPGTRVHLTVLLVFLESMFPIAAAVAEFKYRSPKTLVGHIGSNNQCQCQMYMRWPKMEDTCIVSIKSRVYFWGLFSSKLQYYVFHHEMNLFFFYFKRVYLGI